MFVQDINCPRNNSKSLKNCILGYIEIHAYQDIIIK